MRFVLDVFVVLAMASVLLAIGCSPVNDMPGLQAEAASDDPTTRLQVSSNTLVISDNTWVYVVKDTKTGKEFIVAMKRTYDGGISICPIDKETP